MVSAESEALRIDDRGVFVGEKAITPAELEQLAPRLEDVRREILEVDSHEFRTGEIPEEKQPLDAGFLPLPEAILEAYRSERDASELGRILRVAEQWRHQVDRVVVLGIGGSYMGARALMEACCHPYHNELPRGGRGSRPRMYFEGNNVDNDATSGLLELLGGGRPSATIDGRWALVVISKSGGTLETAVAFRQFLAQLRESIGDDREALAELVIPVTGREGRLRELSQALGCRETFLVPDGVGGRFSVFSAVGLLPAALLGIDVMRLLEGAAAMNEHFRTAPVQENLVLRYAALVYLAWARHGANIRVLSAWSKSLEALGLWHDQLVAESLGKEELGPTPLTVVNTRDLHSRAQQHQQGARDKLIVNLIVEQWRCDPLPVGRSEWDQDGLNAIADRTLPQIMTAAVQGTNQAYREAARPTLDIYLPRIDAFTLGQLMQMLMLATVVEGKMMGINPYGQPGVELYKKHMKRILEA